MISNLLELRQKCEESKKVCKKSGKIPTVQTTAEYIVRGRYKVRGRTGRIRHLVAIEFNTKEEFSSNWRCELDGPGSPIGRVMAREGNIWTIEFNARRVLRWLNSLHYNDVGDVSIGGDMYI
jgi:hypothetical protein